MSGRHQHSKQSIVIPTTNITHCKCYDRDITISLTPKLTPWFTLRYKGRPTIY